MSHQSCIHREQDPWILHLRAVVDTIFTTLPAVMSATVGGASGSCDEEEEEGGKGQRLCEYVTGWIVCVLSVDVFYMCLYVCLLLVCVCACKCFVYM